MEVVDSYRNIRKLSIRYSERFNGPAEVVDLASVLRYWLGRWRRLNTPWFLMSAAVLSKTSMVALHRLAVQAYDLGRCIEWAGLSP